MAINPPFPWLPTLAFHFKNELNKISHHDIIAGCNISPLTISFFKMNCARDSHHHEHHAMAATSLHWLILISFLIQPLNHAIPPINSIMHGGCVFPEEWSCTVSYCDSVNWLYTLLNEVMRTRKMIEMILPCPYDLQWLMEVLSLVTNEDVVHSRKNKDDEEKTD